MQLPHGWSSCSLSDIAAVNPKTVADESLIAGFVPMSHAPTSYHGELLFDEKPWGEIKKSYTNFQDGDVIFAKVTPCFENGKAAIVDDLPNGIGAGSSEFYVLRPHCSDISQKLLFALIKTHAFMQEGAANMTGAVGLRRVPKSFVETFPIALPPAAEQKEIVDRLDILLAQVEATQARLARIPDVIKQFRQSVLAAAVSGKLTEEWREGSSLWQRLTIDNLAHVKGGKRLPQGEELVENDTGFPYIRAGQLKQGTVICNGDARTKQLYLTASAHAQISRYIVEENDVYLTIVGASIGDAGLIPSHYHGANLTENAAKITEFKKPLSSKFLAYWLRSSALQEIIQLEIKSGAQGKLALKRIKELPVPYPELEEQTEIVRRVEQLFAYADTLEQQAKAAKARVDKLTQAILAKAFRGELTADWRAANPDQISGDNSAAALLARIQTERAANGGKKKKRTLKQ
ncbi:restriction endonuclease subunit S [Aeromonas veronii]|uniref:restriction endonuclease subunit S n=1 Tax=Aeromonas veronii TaxID=654 RepID=UPI00226C9415|nr:restriction endonuclease subunit S [Aeromonas veronii]MCX9111491.1 restriction endonuclease subunit S [Aeromonas veronii]